MPNFPKSKIIISLPVFLLAFTLIFQTTFAAKAVANIFSGAKTAEGCTYGCIYTGSLGPSNVQWLAPTFQLYSKTGTISNGKDLYEAVKEYQRQNGLTPDGIIGQATIRSMTKDGSYGNILNSSPDGQKTILTKYAEAFNLANPNNQIKVLTEADKKQLAEYQKDMKDVNGQLNACVQNYGTPNGCTSQEIKDLQQQQSTLADQIDKLSPQQSNEKAPEDLKYVDKTGKKFDCVSKLGTTGSWNQSAKGTVIVAKNGEVDKTGKPVSDKPLSVAIPTSKPELNPDGTPKTSWGKPVYEPTGLKVPQDGVAKGQEGFNRNALSAPKDYKYVAECELKNGVLTPKTGTNYQINFVNTKKIGWQEPTK